MDIHHALVWFVFFGLIYVAAPYWIVMTIIAAVRNLKDFHIRRNTIAFFAGGVAVICLLYSNPYELVAWFGD